jgi:hypothetical protein
MNDLFESGMLSYVHLSNEMSMSEDKNNKCVIFTCLVATDQGRLSVYNIHTSVNKEGRNSVRSVWTHGEMISKE